MNQHKYTLLVSNTELDIIKHAYAQRPKLVINSVVKWLSLNSCLDREPREVVKTCVTPKRICTRVYR